MGIVFVGKRSFTNSSKAAFYSGNLIHTEVDFLDQVTFLTLLCEENYRFTYKVTLY